MSQETVKRSTGKSSTTGKEAEGSTSEKQKEKRRTNTKQEHNTWTCKQKPLFDTAMGSSDAELRVGQKLPGVPPWETQRESTNELTGSNLVEHERLETHP